MAALGISTIFLLALTASLQRQPQSHLHQGEADLCIPHLLSLQPLTTTELYPTQTSFHLSLFTLHFSFYD